MLFYITPRQQLLILLIILAVIIGNITHRLRTTPKKIKAIKIEFTKLNPII
jgi:hypothetical protein